MNKRELTDLFVLLNIWLCLTSLLMVAASAIAVGVELRAMGLGVLLPSFLVYVVYVQDRRSPARADRINQPRRTLLVERYQQELFLSVLVALVGYQALLAGLVLSTAEIDPIFFILGQLPFAVLFYYHQLKQYPGVDSLVVGFTWAFVIVFTVVISTGISVSPELLLVFLAWFIMVFGGVESRNISDRTGDRTCGNATLAVILGARTTKLLEIALKTLGVAVFWIVGGIHAMATVIVWLLLLRICRRTERGRARPA